MKHAFNTIRKGWMRQPIGEETATVIAGMVMAAVVLGVVTGLGMGSYLLAKPTKPYDVAIGVFFVGMGVALFLTASLVGNTDGLTSKSFVAIAGPITGALLLALITPWLMLGGLIVVMGGILIWSLRR